VHRGRRGHDVPRRRKTLRNNLRAALGGEEAALGLLAACEIEAGLRAEALEPSAFRRLAAGWPGGSAGSPLV